MMREWRAGWRNDSRGREYQKQLYELQAWAVMPNHVHLLMLPHAAPPQITHWIKGRTAREANLLLERTGEPFWQDESYDHWVRNREAAPADRGHIRRESGVGGAGGQARGLAVVERWVGR